MKNKVLLLATLFVVLLSVACQPPCDLPQAERNRQDAQLIFAALQTYFDKNNDYPESLDKLVPNYIDYVPNEINGTPLKYTRGNKIYTLLVYDAAPWQPDIVNNFFGNRCYYHPREY